MLIHSVRREMHVDGRPHFIGYLLCVIVVMETATVHQATGAESLGSDGKEFGAQPVRRHAFSVTHDLQTLTKMLNDESQLSRMKDATAFFNALHKRNMQPLKQPLSAVPPKNEKMNIGLLQRRLHM